MKKYQDKFNEEGFIECGGCGGTGMILEMHIEYETYSAPLQCNICKGKGKIDWIEFIRKPPEDYGI
ncbi:MAG: hypothetical protein PVG65_03415 [Candidatus Thorarchaeota archaeon]|jgi:hypothetical protein